MINQFIKPRGLFYSHYSDQNIQSSGMSCSFIFHHFYRNYWKFREKCEDPDQTPRTASDLDLHCLSMSSLWNTKI